MRQQLIAAILKNQDAFGFALDASRIDRLADYYELVLEHNPLLHLVAPCSAEEFAVRHILESLTLLEYLPANAKFADVGTGAGLPSIPCLVARGDLKAILIESKEKKTKFLETAVTQLELAGRATVINKQFDETSAADAGYVTCRALDKFIDRLPRLIKWAGRRKLLLFVGENIRMELEQKGRKFTAAKLPLSEHRYLLILEN